MIGAEIRIHVVAVVIGVFIALPVVDPVALRRERKRPNSLQQRTIRIAAVHAELDDDARSQGLDEPEGKRNVTHPRGRPHETCRVLQLNSACAFEPDSSFASAHVLLGGGAWSRRPFSHNPRSSDRGAGEYRLTTRVACPLMHGQLLHARKWSSPQGRPTKRAGSVAPSSLGPPAARA